MELFYDALQRPVEKPDSVEVDERISGYALVVRDAAVLIVVPTWNTLYELPGGGLEEGEDIVACIERECPEETGYDVEVDGSTVLYEKEQNYAHNDGKFYRSTIRVHPGTLRNDALPDMTRVNVHEREIAQSGFTPIADITKENCHPNFWPVIERAKNA